MADKINSAESFVCFLLLYVFKQPSGSDTRSNFKRSNAEYIYIMPISQIVTFDINKVRLDMY